MERQLLLERVLEDIIKDSKQTDPQRIEKAETLVSTYQEIDKWGIFHFLTTSETSPGVQYKQEVYWPSIHQFKELYQSGGHITLEDFINVMESNDIKITCEDKSFLYWAWAHKAAKNNYGIMVDPGAPTRNNVRLHGGTCKHMLSVLMLISGDPTTQEIMAKQLDEMLSNRYGDGKPSKEFSDIDDNIEQKLPQVNFSTDVDNIEDTETDELTTEEFDAMEKHLIDIIDSYDIVTNEVVNQITRLTPDERTRLLSNILEYIDTQGIDYNEPKVQSVLDLLDWEG